MEMHQVKYLEIAPMIAPNMPTSPTKLYMPLQAMPTYSVLPMHNMMPDSTVPSVSTKREFPDPDDQPMKKRSRDSCRYQKPHTPTVARRNERERNRVKQVNQGFENLRQHVPHAGKNKKMSKVDTLNAAVDYIQQLQTMLKDTDGLTGAIQQEEWNVMDSAKALMSLDCSLHPVHDTVTSPNRVTSTSQSAPSMSSPGGYSTDGSVSGPESTSPHASSHTSPSALTLGEELMDFTSWFQ